MPYKNSSFLALGNYEVKLFLVTQLLDFALPLHRLATRFIILNIRNSIRFMSFSVPSACSIIVLPRTLSEVISVTCIIAPITTLQNVNIINQPAYRTSGCVK